MDLRAWEERAALARQALACVFTSSDEYENALIAERRAEGRYATRLDWTTLLAIGCGLAIVSLTTLLAF